MVSVQWGETFAIKSLVGIFYSVSFILLHLFPGLPCQSQKVLTPGSSYQISSRTCQSGLYPNNEYCYWYFDVSQCVPSISCDSLDIRGQQRRRWDRVWFGWFLSSILRCRGDRLTIETENDDTKHLCGLKRTGVEFTPKHSKIQQDLNIYYKTFFVRHLLFWHLLRDKREKGCKWFLLHSFLSGSWGE